MRSFRKSKKNTMNYQRCIILIENPSPEAPKIMSEINQAYDILIPKNNVAYTKKDTDIVLIDSIRSDLLNNWNCFLRGDNRKNQT